jgi:hypothetical protein
VQLVELEKASHAKVVCEQSSMADRRLPLMRSKKVAVAFLVCGLMILTVASGLTWGISRDECRGVANQKGNDQILQCVVDQASGIEANSLAPTFLIAAGVAVIAAGMAFYVRAQRLIPIVSIASDFDMPPSNLRSILEQRQVRLYRHESSGQLLTEREGAERILRSSEIDSADDSGQ